MTIVGFNFTNVTAEKKEVPKGRISISNNVVIEKVEPSKFALGKDKQDTLKFTFKFTSKFEPKVGVIELLGSLVFIDSKEKVDEVLQTWKKGKSLPKDVMTEVMNIVLARSTMQALILSRDINLPSPIQLPKVKVQTK